MKILNATKSIHSRIYNIIFGNQQIIQSKKESQPHDQPAQYLQNTNLGTNYIKTSYQITNNIILTN